MSDHSDFVALATEMIKEDGRMITIVSLTNSGDDFNPTRSETNTQVMAVQVGFKNNEVNGETVLKSDLKYLIDSAVPIEIDNVIKDKGRQYSVVDFDLIGPGDQDILYKVQARL